MAMVAPFPGLLRISKRPPHRAIPLLRAYLQPERFRLSHRAIYFKSDAVILDDQFQ